MDKKEIKAQNTKEIAGEDLLKEYLAQDKDKTHKMGYSVYAQTHSDCGCC